MIDIGMIAILVLAFFTMKVFVEWIDSFISKK